MLQFESLGALAQHLTSDAITELRPLQRGLERAAVLIEKSAKEEIGHYQPDVGPFPEWAQLAESTEAQKAAHGYPTGAPLLRTGALQKSIQHEVHPLEAIIGSTDEVMTYHEFGTSKMPPRPVMGPALFKNIAEVQRLIGGAAAEGLAGGQVIPGDDYSL